MLRWILIFLIIALAASALGLFSIEGTALLIVRILLLVFIVLLILSFLGGGKRFGL